ncbi:LysR family transcriptional regulator [Thermomonospora umbrina]|uniref:DNA-binding transcriptional LysR family regulator n=1 Tax=Thermomonospora umbrina TaxID=111806 RepID=A0A3D9SPK4_9ACTN|nr:LysR family transcriptional regulator [Thermomonospora umbrina]REE95893.1 DNA-binding transcriptional LysR family regulator [Thermomonospora umbrina]
MNLIGHLECFVAVAEELHFGHAAERLGMAQPPLSQRIQRLEKELGLRLFDRSSRHVELTAPGRLLLDEARDLLTRVDRIHSLAARARLGAVGAVRVGLPADLGGPVLAALIADFREHCPDLRLEPREIGTAEQCRALAEGTLDVGVLRHPADTRDFDLGPMLAQPLGALLPAGSPEARGGPLHPADLDGREIVLFPREDAPGAHDELLAACRRHGLDPAAVHEARNPQFALGLVLAGTAVALTAPIEEEGVVWRPIAGDPLALRTSCAWPKGRRDPVLERAVERFTSIATRVLRRHAGMAPLERAVSRRVMARPASGFLS